MADMPWREAIVKVLQDSGTPMHYAEIAQAISDSGYRVNVGATPANTVAANLSESIRSRRRSPFVKVDRGVYALRETMQKPREAVDATDQAEQDSEEMGLINAFGMFWDRHQVDWDRKPISLLGMQQAGSTPVDFAGQAGVYVLYDIHRPSTSVGSPSHASVNACANTPETASTAGGTAFRGSVCVVRETTVNSPPCQSWHRRDRLSSRRWKRCSSRDWSHPRTGDKVTDSTRSSSSNTPHPERRPGSSHRHVSRYSCNPQHSRPPTTCRMPTWSKVSLGYSPSSVPSYWKDVLAPKGAATTRGRTPRRPIVCAAR